MLGNNKRATENVTMNELTSIRDKEKTWLNLG